MKNLILENVMRRKLLALAVLLPSGVGRGETAKTVEPSIKLRRFLGINPELVVDAVPGAEMEEVVLYDDRGFQIFTRALLSRRNSSIMAASWGRVPLSVRGLWRRGTGWDKVRRVWNDGVVAGDYTIPVAERIPDDVLHEIRAHGGALRLKFRLTPDGILFGWDIARKAALGEVSTFDMPGGDFLETRY